MEAFRSGGPGGQHRNVTDSAVRLLHSPSGVHVIAADSRSQHRNRETAFGRLIRRLQSLNRVPARRVPTRVPTRAVERRLVEKKLSQAIKRLRGGVRDQDD